MVFTRFRPSSTSLKISAYSSRCSGGQVLALVAQREQAGRGKVERVVDLVNDARAHPAQRGQFLGLHQLHFGFLELLDGGLQRLFLLRSALRW